MDSNSINRQSLSFSVIILSAALSILGLCLAGLLPLKLSPERSARKLEVSFTTGGMSPWTTETAVTSKIEAVCARIEGISEIMSKSERGSGKVTLSLDRNSNEEQSRFEVSIALRQIWDQLPRGTSYPQVRIVNSEGSTQRPFMIYGISADTSTEIIEKYANDIIIPEIGGIDGVSSCMLTGVTRDVWGLEYDSGKLDRLNINHQDIEKNLRENFQTIYLGLNEISGKWQRVMAETYQRPEGVFNPSDLWIDRKPHDSPISGGSILMSRLLEDSASEIFRINGRSMVYCLIFPEGSANQIRLSSEIERVMGETLHHLPHGYFINQLYDASERISSELNTLFLRTALTILILLIFVGVTSKSFKYTLLISVSLFFNIALSFILYYILKIEIQLYTLAAITISLNIVIDNLIVMSEHLMRERNLSVFTSILTASLTTAGALVIVFFLEEDIRITLEHFVLVVIVNLMVSLLVALFVVPALIERMHIQIQPERNSNLNAGSGRWYAGLLIRLPSHKKILIILLIFLFGTPIFLLPRHIDEEKPLAHLYNTTLGSDFYTFRLRPIVDIVTGGTLRLFVEDVYKGEYSDTAEEEPVLAVLLTMPAENDISMTDETIRNLEDHLASFSAIRQVQSSIYPQRAIVEIFFTRKGIDNGLPSVIKNEVASYVQTLGAGTWHVSGVNNDNFTNSIRESTGNITVHLTGYDYTMLEALASQLQDSLAQHRRFQVPTISAEPVKWRQLKQEYHYAFDRERLSHFNLNETDVVNALRSERQEDAVVGIIDDNEVILKSSITIPTEWQLANQPMVINGNDMKLNHIGSFSLKSSPSEIVKKNQEYQLYLQVGYIGHEKYGTEMIDIIIARLQKNLPMGFSIVREETRRSFTLPASNWSLLLLGIIIIFFITSILFGNIRQSIAIILTIPISYIGLFLAFYFSGAKLDQGALAAFVLLSGLTANMAIYLLDTMNELSQTTTHSSQEELFVKAWQIKRKSILLTVLTSILGFIPFLIGIDHESFWYTLALGTIGGLAIGLIGVLIFLPLFALRKPKI